MGLAGVGDVLHGERCGAPDAGSVAADAGEVDSVVAFVGSPFTAAGCGDVPVLLAEVRGDSGGADGVVD